MSDEQNEIAGETDLLDKPRRGRPPKDEAKALDPNATAKITYLPGEGDPVKTVWNGIEFRANIPVAVPLNKTILVPLRKEWIDNNGDLKSKAVETRISMVEMAKTNACFSVDGAPPPERKHGAHRLPTDADQYRGYALGWIRETNTLRQLTQRWDGEAALREKCGLDQKDENYLMPFVHARREQLGEAVA